MDVETNNDLSTDDGWWLIKLWQPISPHKEMAPVGFTANAPSDVYRAAFKKLNEAVSKVESSNSTKRQGRISFQY